VFRPADATETTECWRLALERKDGPSVLALTRQKLPVLDRSVLAPAAGVRQGAYVLKEAVVQASGGQAAGLPKVILLATGSEVSIALAAAEILEKEGTPTRVVSMPSWEIFAAQPQAYRDQVLPPSVTARVSMEAAATFGWDRWIGSAGRALGLDHFGASAPAERLYQEFGLTAARMADTARAVLAGRAS
jgi:transketolase